MADMKEIVLKSPQATIRKAIELGNNNQSNLLVFRGQSNSKWKIESTYHRYASWKIRDFFEHGVETITNLFIERAIRNGHHNLRSYNKRGQLEYARHAGVPSPLVDFSYSPLVALWFAFSGVDPNEKGHAALYVLNIDIFRVLVKDFLDKQVKNNKLPPNFTSLTESVALKNFPDALIFLASSASWNIKMYRQKGCFVYDGLSYTKYQNKCLEDILISDELSEKSSGVLERYLIPKKYKYEILEFLKSIGIGGEYLYNDEQGILIDLLNERLTLDALKAWDLKRR